MKRRDANIILVSAAAIGGGGAAAAIPLDMLGLAVRASGLPAFVPAAAPPLGDTARLGCVGLAAFMASGAVALVLIWQKHRAAKRQEDETMGFMTSKFGGLFRRETRRIEAEAAAELEEEPVELAPSVRRSDAHPDAPPRAPLVVSRDLAGEAPPILEEEPRGPIIEDITGLSMPRVPEPLPWEEIESEMNRLLGGVAFRPIDEQPVADQQYEASEPSIKELTERLERGFARLRAAGAAERQEAESTEEPASAADDMLAESPESDVPTAPGDLDNALTALRTITARAS